LKHVNDTLGHEAGDELICGAADCIQKVMGAGIPCYRTGGDEFVVLTEMSHDMIDRKLSELEQALNHWSGNKVKELHLAVGYAVASDYDDMSAEKLVAEADLAMYEAKTAYYKSVGKERRHH
jgi:diguanylate cyclase (GGDEF)-like protein